MTTDSSRPLGEWLQQRREELGISLEQAEADTRIRRYYLEALESEKFNALPDHVVGRGFLRNYASYLALDPKEASERYSALVAPPQPESLSVEGPTPFTTGSFQPVPLHKIAGRRSRWVWIAGLVLVLVAAASLLVWWGYPRINAWWAQQQAAALIKSATTMPRETGASPATATRTPTATIAAAGETIAATGTVALTGPAPTLELTLTPTLPPSPSPSPSPPVYTGIFLELVFTDTSWVQVTIDGVREFQGELESDTHRSWYGEERIELRVGNAGAVLVTINGQSLGTLGQPGEVIDRVFEKVDGDVTEATVTPVPTTDETPEPTAAPTRTSAPPTRTSAPPTRTSAPSTATIAPSATISPTVTVTPTATIAPTATP